MSQFVKRCSVALFVWSAVCLLPSLALAHTESVGEDCGAMKPASSSRDAVPPDAITDLAAARSMPDVILTWSIPLDDVGVTSFRIFQHQTPTDEGLQITHILNEAAQICTVRCVCGSPAINFLYDVRAEDAAGNVAPPSNLAGEFDYMVQEGPVGPAIAVAPTCLVILVQPGDASSDTLVVSNPGDGLLTIDAVETDEPWVTGEFGVALPLEIPSGASAILTVNVDAGLLSAGEYEVALSITSNDPDEPLRMVGIDVTVPLVEMVSIPGGTFQMGSDSEWAYPNEQPVHQVTVRAFSISKHEATQAQYEAVMGTNPSSFQGAHRPVERVSWFDAAQFCNALSASEGLTPCYDESDWTCAFSANGYRLPTEAEWEYACRAGTITDFYGGDETATGQDPIMDLIGWYYHNAGSQTHDACGKQGNSCGLYDMSGNVWEWCNDWYAVYSSEASTDPTGPPTGTGRVHRGGSWSFFARDCRSACRDGGIPSGMYDDMGFRIVRR